MCSTFVFIFRVRNEPELKERLLNALESNENQTINIGRFIIMFFPKDKKVEYTVKLSTLNSLMQK